MCVDGPLFTPFFVAGDRKETSPYDITFGDQVPWRQLCEVDLTPEQVQQFKEAVHDDYYFEMLVEDLPMWGYIGEITGEDLILGELEDSRTYLFPHLHFKIGVNDNKIVSTHVFTQSHRKVSPHMRFVDRGGGNGRARSGHSAEPTIRGTRGQTSLANTSSKASKARESRVHCICGAQCAFLAGHSSRLIRSFNPIMWSARCVL